MRFLATRPCDLKINITSFSEYSVLATMSNNCFVFAWNSCLLVAPKVKKTG